MTLDKFQDAYKKAAQELPTFSMDAEKVQDGAHHDKMRRQRYKYIAARGCTAAMVFLLCGVGTVAAKNYRSSVIRIEEGGFIITSIPDSADSKSGGVFSAVDTPDDSGIECCDSRGRGIDSLEYDYEEYDTLEDFLESGSAVAVGPDKALFEVDFTRENVQVMEEGREVFILLSNEDSSFFLRQSDNRGFVSYSSATTFGGETVDERSYTNSQGLNYVVFDTVDEAGRSVHAVISVNGWDLSVTFSGFDDEIVERVLDALDLTVYFQE